MTTLDDVLTTQKTDNVLYAPTIGGGPTEIHEDAVAASGTLNIGLYNSTTSNTVYAYITGLAINNNNALFLLQADGQTAYYPSNPSSDGTPLSTNCAIALGGVGSTTNVTIPYIAGGRIWFCVNNTLTFLLNPGSTGPGLVEPSVCILNPSAELSLTRFLGQQHCRSKLQLELGFLRIHLQQLAALCQYQLCRLCLPAYSFDPHQRKQCCEPCWWAPC